MNSRRTQFTLLQFNYNFENIITGKRPLQKYEVYFTKYQIYIHKQKLLGFESPYIVPAIYVHTNQLMICLYLNL